MRNSFVCCGWVGISRHCMIHWWFCGFRSHVIWEILAAAHGHFTVNIRHSTSCFHFASLWPHEEDEKKLHDMWLVLVLMTSWLSSRMKSCIIRISVDTDPISRVENHVVKPLVRVHSFLLCSFHSLTLDSRTKRSYGPPPQSGKLTPSLPSFFPSS